MTASVVSYKPAATKPLRVLIVDDNQPDIEMLERMLRRALGAELLIRSATDGLSAIEIVHHESIDVLLVDYRLPDMDGLELLGRLSDVGSLAVILLTGQGNESLAAKAIKSGARDYLVKQDVTEEELRRAVMEAAQAARQESDERRRAQQVQRTHLDVDHFVRSLSHDMSANFMVLENTFRQLKHSTNQPHLRKLLDGMSHVEACLRDSKRYLDDLQLLARSGTVHMEPARIELSRLIAEVVFEFDELLMEHNVAVRFESDLPAVFCNETRARQVFSNLIRNAVEHGCDSRQPSIGIAQIAPRLGECADYVWLRIHDNGHGIPAARREEIFQPGRRLDETRPGTGMGLAIVKRVVEYYGGPVFVDPECHSGTAFVLALPRAPEINGAGASSH